VCRRQSYLINACAFLPGIATYAQESVCVYMYARTYVMKQRQQKPVHAKQCAHDYLLYFQAW
jgi:hypothetical protein